MKEQIKNVTDWLKNIHTAEYNVRGCITGSSLLGYFPDSKQDVDIFLYDENSFRNIYYAMYYNDMFQILDPLEKWKFEEEINTIKKKKQWLITIKFTYNTCIPVNIIYKSDCTNIYGVLSTFDLDIVSKGYDTETKQTLDLTEGSTITKIASWNKYNTNFYNPKIWQISRILRQLERCFKYHKRGYNTDNVVLKYIELIDGLQDFVNIFNSENYTERLETTKNNTKVVKQICETWLETHEITDEELELLKTKIKKI